MEVLGVFLFAQLFNPLPWHFHVVLAAYNGVGGAIDHSAFYIPGTIIDGRCVRAFFFFRVVVLCVCVCFGGGVFWLVCCLGEGVWT